MNTLELLELAVKEHPDEQTPRDMLTDEYMAVYEVEREVAEMMVKLIVVPAGEAAILARAAYLLNDPGWIGSALKNLIAKAVGVHPLNEVAVMLLPGESAPRILPRPTGAPRPAGGISATVGSEWVCVTAKCLVGVVQVRDPR